MLLYDTTLSSIWFDIEYEWVEWENGPQENPSGIPIIREPQRTVPSHSAHFPWQDWCHRIGTPISHRNGLDNIDSSGLPLHDRCGGIWKRRLEYIERYFVIVSAGLCHNLKVTHDKSFYPFQQCMPFGFYS